MSDFDTPSPMLEKPGKRPSRFGDLGERLARTFIGPDPRGEAELPPGLDVDPESPTMVDAGSSWEPPGPRFPFSRHGYEPAAVDAHLVELERELAELQTRASPVLAVEAEIERLGEQTTTILRTAYEQAQETTQRAREHAEGCIADARANAYSITEEAQRKLSELDSETDTVWRERARLIEDARDVAASLLVLADAAAQRFPGEPTEVVPSVSPASQPAASPIIVGFDDLPASADLGDARFPAEVGDGPTQAHPPED